MDAICPCAFTAEFAVDVNVEGTFEFSCTDVGVGRAVITVEGVSVSAEEVSTDDVEGTDPCVDVL